MKVLLYGSRGYIGGQLKALLEGCGHEVICPLTRIESRTVMDELREHMPERVVSCTGRTHGKGENGVDIRSIDYLELPGKVDENIKDNLYGPLHLATLCHSLGIHYTYIGTGCIYTSRYGEDGIPSNIFTEEDEPNFKGSSYSLVKGYTDQLLTQTPLKSTTLTIRIRLPIAGTPNPRNTITKLVSYQKIHSVENSVTCFSLLPKMVTMIEHGHTGAFNFCNKGSITNGRILELYQKHVDPSHKFEYISGEDLSKQLPAKRSNTVLETSKLEQIFPDLETAEDAVESCLREYAALVKESD